MQFQADVRKVDRDLRMRLFLAQAEDAFRAMERALDALDGSAHDNVALGTLLRVARALKTDAGTLGLAVFADTARRLENALDQLRSGSVAGDRESVDIFVFANDSQAILMARPGGGRPSAGRADAGS